MEEGSVLRPVLNEEGEEEVPLTASQALRAQRGEQDHGQDGSVGSVKSLTSTNQGKCGC